MQARKKESRTGRPPFIFLTMSTPTLPAEGEVITLKKGFRGNVRSLPALIVSSEPASRLPLPHGMQPLPKRMPPMRTMGPMRPLASRKRSVALETQQKRFFQGLHLCMILSPPPKNAPEARPPSKDSLGDAGRGWRAEGRGSDTETQHSTCVSIPTNRNMRKAKASPKAKMWESSL